MRPCSPSRKIRAPVVSPAGRVRFCMSAIMSCIRRPRFFIFRKWRARSWGNLARFLVWLFPVVAVAEPEMRLPLLLVPALVRAALVLFLRWRGRAVGRRIGAIAGATVDVVCEEPVRAHLDLADDGATLRALGRLFDFLGQMTLVGILGRVFDLLCHDGPPRMVRAGWSWFHDCLGGILPFRSASSVAENVAPRKPATIRTMPTASRTILDGGVSLTSSDHLTMLSRHVRMVLPLPPLALLPWRQVL